MVSNYQLTGQEMEDLSNEHFLRVIVTTLIRQSPLTSNYWEEDKAMAASVGSKKDSEDMAQPRSLFSLRTHQTYLQSLATFLGDVIYQQCILTSDFNEWGALLLYSEVKD